MMYGSILDYSLADMYYSVRRRRKIFSLLSLTYGPLMRAGLLRATNTATGFVPGVSMHLAVLLAQSLLHTQRSHWQLESQYLT